MADRLNLEHESLMEQAQAAFWAVVADAHPEITTGDFGPLETARFNEACETAIKRWVEGNSPRRPLVIVGVGWGLVQWTVVKPGIGVPRLHELDYDREGQGGQELLDFAEQIEAARADLADYEDEEDTGTLFNMSESIREYEQMVGEGKAAGRSRF